MSLNEVKAKSIHTPLLQYEQPVGLYINGEWVAGKDGNTLETLNPATGKPIVSVHAAGPEDVDVAVGAARRAFDTVWSSTTPSQRGALLTKLADLFQTHSETLAAIEALDNGKGISTARGDVHLATESLRYYGGWADKIHGKVMDVDDDTINFTRHEPLGVCGLIVPWNFPILMWSFKVGPAIATGNTVVLKSAEQTPLSALYAATLIEKAGFPPGVINILSGFGKTAGQAMTHHMDIDMISFTGSPTTGREVMRASANSNLKKVALELGGKSPTIVFDDANIEDAIHWVRFGIFFNNGQCCTAGSRIYVQSRIYDEFVERFKTATRDLVLGDPFDPNTFQGPQVSQLQFDRIMGYIDGGKAGAKLEIGGKRYGKDGYFIEPTIFSDVSPNLELMQEEVFGPVCAISKFESEEEVTRSGNSTTYGLAASVHTTDVNTAMRMVKKLKAGTVWVNAHNMISYQVPHGGFKQSGFGRELGKYALTEYCQPKSVRIKVSQLDLA